MEFEDIEREAKRINHKVSTLWCDDATVIRKLCELYDEWLNGNKYYDFEYKVIAPEEFDGIYVLFWAEKEYMMTDKEFCEFVGQNLEDYVLREENVEVMEEHFNDVVSEWSDELKKIEELATCW